ncbi:MAG: sulfurtransferase TusA family protein [Candidatus Dormibacteria bacterium]
MEPRRLDLTSAEDGCGDSALGRVRRAYATLAPGAGLEVVTGVAEHVFGIEAWSRRVGGELVEESREPGRTRLLLRRPAG